MKKGDLPQDYHGIRAEGESINEERQTLPTLGVSRGIRTKGGGREPACAGGKIEFRDHVRATENVGE